jgi:phage terminase small subunit
VLHNWQQETMAGSLPSLQQHFMQHQQHVGLSPGHSCQSNTLDVQLQDMFSNQDYQQQQQMQPGQQQEQGAAADAAYSWHQVVQNPGLKQAASRICEEQLSFDLDQQQQQLDSTMLLGVTANGDFLQPNAAAAAAAAAGYSPDVSGMHSGSGCLTSPSHAAAGEEASGDGAAECAGDGAECSGGKPVLPHVSLRVACGDMIGTLLVHRARIVINEGTGDEKEVSPTEFERLGGRSATKKWKQSIRLVNDDGERRVCLVVVCWCCHG